MALRDTPPFRADHVGSLLRPPALARRAREARSGRPRRRRAARRRGRRPSATPSRMQGDVGLRSATDGEFRRASWHMDFIYALDGVAQARGRHHRAVPQRATGDIEFTPAALRVDGRIGSGETIFGDDFAFLRDDRRRRRDAEAHDPVAEHGPLPRRRAPRSTRTSTPTSTSSGRTSTPPTPSSCAARHDVGCTLPPVRRHEPRLPQRPAPASDDVASAASDPEHLHERYIRHINAALAGGPTGMAITTHMCRGNYRSSWVGRGRLRLRRRGAVQRARRRRLLPGVRRRALRRLRAAALRARGQAGRARPRDDEDAASSRPRTSSSGASRRPRATSTLDQLCLSPQCGFSSTVEGNDLTLERAVREAAAGRRDRRGGLGLTPQISDRPPSTPMLWPVT